MRWRGMIGMILGIASLANAGPEVLTYQGSVLGPAGQPIVDGTYDMRFSIYDGATTGTQKWTETESVEVRGGLYSVVLGETTPFGEMFTLDYRLWLEVAIDRNGDQVFDSSEVYAPRQLIASAAWAIDADRLQGRGASEFQLRVTGFAPDGSYISAINVDGTVATAPDRDTYDWPSITDKPTSFPPALHSHDWQELTGIPSGFADGIDNDSGGDITAVNAGLGLTGGGTTGAVTLALDPAFFPEFSWSLAGNAGTSPSINFLGTLDSAPLDLRTSGSRVLRLAPNEISPNIIGGHRRNSAGAGVFGATIGGGGNAAAANTATANYTTIGGGSGNTAEGGWTTIGGGLGNAAAGGWSTVAGGGGNSAGGNQATVGGGELNRAGGNWATVGGGADNAAGGLSAVIPGGRHNSAAGDYSFAAGLRAKSNHAGAFVWAGSNGFDLVSTGANTFNVRATGGSRFISAVDAFGTPTAGVVLPAGGGAWSSLSDRNLKENFRPVDGREVLARLAVLPIASWNYTSQEPAIRHMGPTAQDLHAAFGLGESDRAIATIDADGISLAAIQGLYEVVKEKEARIAEQEKKIVELESRLAAIEAQLNPIGR